MTQAAPSAIAITRAVTAVLRNDRGRLLAALVARLRDFQLAEDALQDAALAALSHWGRSGLPASPFGWLLKVAQRKALDRLRSGARAARHATEMALIAEDEAADPADPAAIPDERLRLIFACCHPALEEKTCVALTLRSLCGLTTAEVARVFLDTEPTMGQRLSRARAKITTAGIPYAVPPPELWPERLNSVLTVIYLIFTAGYAQGPATGTDLCHEAIFLARLMLVLAPDHAETEGALALMLVTQARAGARVSASGETLPPDAQDRALWDGAMLAEGVALLDLAVARRAPGPFQIKAAIAALHAEPGPPDWPQITALLARLMTMEPTPVVALNHAVALAETGALAKALAQVEGLASQLSNYQPWHAARADLLARLGRTDAARAAYDRAIRDAASANDAAFLARRRDLLP